jgi:hypothetical protein
MATPNSRESLKQYCLRRLGVPVISINVDDEQIEDRIDDALNMWTEYAVDATNKVYVSMTVTQNNMNTSSFTMDPSIINVTRIFPIIGSSTGSAGPENFNIFDLNYQLRLNELYDFTSADYVYFELAQQHIRTLEILFIGETPIRFNRYDGNLYIDGLVDVATVGTMVIAECYQILPANNTMFWNDIWLKEYTTCLIKHQWGTNMRKFKEVPMVGGVKLSGQEILDEATVDKERLEARLRDTYEAPIPFLIG